MSTQSSAGEGKMKSPGKEKKRVRQHRKGFTLIELMVGSAVMMVIILGTLSLYVKSNRVSVDHQQFAELQHDVRSSMFFVMRDVRSTGVGLTDDVSGYFIEGVDGFGPSPESADSIKLAGNFDHPLKAKILKYQGGGGGGAATAFLYEMELENSPYGCPDFYENRVIFIWSATCPGCFAWRYLPANSVHGCESGAVHFNMQPGKALWNPPGGLVDSNCAADCYEDGFVTFGQIKHYWLDTTGNPGDYPSLNLTVNQDGYLGLPNTLYLTTFSDTGSLEHMALAQNVENLQFQYNRIDASGNFLGFTDWDASWTPDDISRIRQVRIWILGKTANPFVSVGKKAPSNLHLYRRPAVANSPVGSKDDKHRRFLLESTANIRNLSLNLYNTGSR